MYYSSFVSKQLVPIVALVGIQVVIIRSVSSVNISNEYLNTKCYEKQGKYKSGSLYDSQLKHIIRSAYLGDFANGFQHASGTKGSIYTSVNYQSRPDDTSKTKCRACFLTAINLLQRKCPKYKGGIIWFDQCLLEISAVDTMKKIDFDNRFCMSNSKDMTGDPLAFQYMWGKLIDRLITKAIKGESKFYAAGMSRFGKEKIYGMVECTNDLSSNSCKECLVQSIIKFQDCYRDKRGGRAFGRSCSLRFEFYPFLKVRS